MISAPREHLVLRAKGVFLLAIVGALIALSIAVYNKSFSDSVRVLVEAERAGLQLNPNGDVRMRGKLVGRVDGLELEGDRAVVRLDIDRDVAGSIPKNVHARIVPTTMFGQKYVDLVNVGAASAEPIAANGVIPLDRSRTAVELNEAFDDVEALLTAVRPQDLSATLQAVSSGLEGRGDLMGENAVRVSAYLEKFNVELPLLIRDLRAFGSTAQLYADAAPDLLGVLSNSTVTGATVIAIQDEMRESFLQLTALADESRVFFERNGDAMVDVNRISRPVLELLARYSPEYGCLLVALVSGNREAAKVFHDRKLHLSVTFGPEYSGYTANDHPENGDVGTGPACMDLPHPKLPLKVPDSRDGITMEPLFAPPGGS